MLFMLHESILLKDEKGTTSEVTYLGSQLLDEVFLHNIRNKNGHEFLVDGNLCTTQVPIMEGMREDRSRSEGL